MSLPGPTDVGVIIGRFQVPTLHPGHRQLFQQVLARHKRVLVLLGVPAWLGGVKNPLDYKTRETMIREYYPSVTIGPIRDRQTNEEWSEDVDKTIRSIYPIEKVTLYGGREGFTSYYTGVFPTVETLEDPTFDDESGTNLRDAAASLPRISADFRAGVIYANYGLPTAPVMCVDGAVIQTLSKTGNQIMLIKKSNELHWRFPGGKLDPTDKSLEKAVIREVREETGLEVGTPVYIGSDGGVPDWRGEQSGIVIASSLFFIPYVFGAVRAGDDAFQAKWFSLDSLTEKDMEQCHKNFLVMLQTWLQDRNNRDYVHAKCVGDPA